MIWTISDIKNLNGYHRRLSNFYFMLIGLPIIALFISIMWWYKDMNKVTMSLQQARLMSEYKTWLFYISGVEFIGVVILIRWYVKQLKVIRNHQLFSDRLKSYYSLNVKYYLIMWAIALPLVPLYIYTGFLFFVGIYSVIVFMIMAMERPSIYRTIRNLKLKDNEKKVVKEGGEISQIETSSN